MPSPLRLVRRLLVDLSRVSDLMAIAPAGERRQFASAWLRLTAAAHGRRDAYVKLVWTGPAEERLECTACDVSELWVMREMFYNREYELPAEAAPQVILDLGSNAGMSVIYFRDRYPTAQIVAVEPSPTTFDRLRRNVGHLDNVTLVKAAAAAVDGSITLYETGESWAATTVGPAGSGPGVEVSAKTVETILREAGVDRADLVKMDIEGAEHEVLASKKVSEADWIAFEFHPQGPRTIWDLIRDLPDFEILRLVGRSDRMAVVTLRRKNIATARGL